MKKFITTAPRQAVVPEMTGRPETECYRAVDNPLLQYDVPACFPLLPLINAYVVLGDCFEVFILTAQYENCYRNFDYLKAEIETISRQIGASCIVTMIEIPFDETITTHLDTFRKLIEQAEPRDIFYADITYGTKPTPMIEIMALNYAYRVCDNVSVECVVYGEKDFQSGKKRIFDVTSLFFMDQIVNELAKSRNKDPLKAIKGLLQINNSMEE